MSSIRYIPEIDGLRAVAVLPVIVFHLGLSWLPGGFLGVDVFFVISGYLITAILLTEQAKPTGVYFADFYLRRLRRIFPAFFAVIVATLAVSYFILLPDDYLELGRSALAALTFVPNIYFYFNTGYFDAPAESMALLHTWSLGVEEQFYLLWPSLILFLVTLGRRWSVVLVATLFVCSLAAAVVVTPLDPPLAFYNLPFRIFQFLLGAAIPLYLTQLGLSRDMSAWQAGFCQLGGLALIAMAMVFFSSDHPFPGWRALVPALGASLFIVGATSGKTGKLNPMASWPMVAIGKISFSLYLWHWPVITLYRVYLGGHDSSLLPAEVFTLSLLILALSIGTYFLIERPFRRPNRQLGAMVFSGLSALLVIGACFSLQFTQGFVHRMPQPELYESREVMKRWSCWRRVYFEAVGKRQCNFGVPWEEAQQTVVLTGDSHAVHLAPALNEVALEHQLSVVMIPACRPLTDGKTILLRGRNARRSTKLCHDQLRAGIDLIERDGRVSLVIVGGAWYRAPPEIHTADNPQPSREEAFSLMATGLGGYIRELGELGADVLLLGDTPLAGVARFECSTEHNLWRAGKQDCGPIPLAEVLDQQGDTEALIKSIAAAHANATYHNIIEPHCAGGSCPIYFSWQYIYRDAEHIRRNLPRPIVHDLVDSFGLMDALDWSRYRADRSSSGAASGDKGL